MLKEVLRAKIENLTVTETNLEYSGSIGIDQHILQAAGLQEYDRVQVLNVNTGTRLETYIVPLPPGSGWVSLLGPAARLSEVGDELVVLAYGLVEVSPDLDQPTATVSLEKTNELPGKPGQ